MKAHFILYVSDQKASTVFYENVLGLSPRLNAPGMTEFELGTGAILGLMPESGASRLFGGRVSTGSGAHRPSRAEIYLIVPDAAAYHARALSFGAEEISELALRDWGHKVAYSRDPDGHILAFAED